MAKRCMLKVKLLNEDMLPLSFVEGDGVYDASYHCVKRQVENVM